jgi:hypothetical protein
MPVPLLADFATRLAGGLAAMLLTTPWRVVPPPFFRTHCQVILGLLVLAALDLGRSSGGGFGLALTIGAAALAFVASVAWGLGLPRVGTPLTAALTAAAAAWLALGSRGAIAGLWALDAAGRLASGFLLGATLSAMLLGHYYLTAPAMSIDPLRRFVRAMAWALGLRAGVAAMGLAAWSGGVVPATAAAGVSPLILAMRWGMGIAGPAVATYLAWETVKIRSTQSATGILYIAMTLVLFGELSAMILARDIGVAL